MASNTLHIFFLPFLSPGHILPMVDMAKLFARRGVKATLVTTPGNATRIRDSLDHDNIQLLLVPFSSSVAGLPTGCDNLMDCSTPDVTEGFYRAMTMLRQPFEQLLREHAPDCIISDVCYPWTATVAGEFGIPRLIFIVTGAFSSSAVETVDRNKPHLGISSDTEAFVLPELPDRIEVTRLQLPEFLTSSSEHMKEFVDTNLKGYGVVLNSFRELEPNYATYKAAGLKTWLIGPLSLCNREAAEKAVRGEKASGENAKHCLSWLDAQAPGSVMYVCFGSLGRFSTSQMREIALGLEASGHPFLWVVGSVDGGGRELLPEGFEERTRGRGLVMWGWVPQLLILGHWAMGGFTTHCGWNSTLEGIIAGLPMVAWPLFADHFFSEKFIVQVLRVGVAVGATVCTTREDERPLVGKERVQEAVVRVMGGGEEAEAMRKTAKELAAMAKTAVEEGGSSYNSLSDLIEDLIGLRKARATTN